jgi:hypothetical protein
VTLHPRTRATLDELERAAWFSAVGQPVSGPCVVLGSWPEAVASCASLEWENLTLEAANAYAVQLARRNRVRWDRWNDVVKDVKPASEALVARKIRSVVDQHSLPKVFADTVSWDILHVCMEAEYADVFPPGFYASQAYWYVQGHFPCGWEGAFPEGKLILY